MCVSADDAEGRVGSWGWKGNGVCVTVGIYRKPFLFS